MGKLATREFINFQIAIQALLGLTICVHLGLEVYDLADYATQVWRTNKESKQTCSLESCWRAMDARGKRLLTVYFTKDLKLLSFAILLLLVPYLWTEILITKAQDACWATLQTQSAVAIEGLQNQIYGTEDLI